MTQCEVSIILPTYNREERLQPCVQSVSSQAFKNWELVVCDDASTDHTSQTIAELGKSDKRIRYFKNTTNQGLPANRNIGISKAKANLILFIEDDVILEPDCIAILLDTYKQLSTHHQVGALAPCRPDEWQGDNDSKRDALSYAWRARNQTLAVPCKLDPLTGVIHHNFVPSFTEIQEVPSVHACSLYPKKALEKVGGYDSLTYKGNYLYEEADLNIRLRKSGYKLYFQPAALMHHKLAPRGGCRIDTLRYTSYFFLNHTKFVLKNFGLRSIWMVPSFFLSIGLLALRALPSYAKSVVSHGVSSAKAKEV